ncbi:uncharacterized protein IL334_007692 [Kwoniella shivajii]|uniref:Wings apart-like protein C-terminal domain-containing protein n=1 Tax=Kwoniella shivajii TaxID=564305 RepID=A0ABZ1DB76_9TREE|nr:hypothetical protein IL334_007692 [Kwoniella shivajii]
MNGPPGPSPQSQLPISSTPSTTGNRTGARARVEDESRKHRLSTSSTIQRSSQEQSSSRNGINPTTTAGPSRFPSAQRSNSQRPPLNINRGGVLSSSQRQAKDQKPNVNRFTDRFANLIAHGKGQGKSTEPIDLTSDTDEEGKTTSPKEKHEKKLGISDSLESITSLDKDMKRSVKKERSLSRAEKKSKTPVSISKGICNTTGLSPEKPIYIGSSSSDSSSTTTTKSPIKATQPLKSVPHTNVNKPNGPFIGNNISLSPQKRRILPPQSTRQRLTTSELDAAFEKRKRDGTKSRTNSVEPGQMLDVGKGKGIGVAMGMGMKRSISRESLIFGLPSGSGSSSNSPRHKKMDSPLKNGIPLPSISQSPLRQVNPLSSSSTASQSVPKTSPSAVTGQRSFQTISKTNRPAPPSEAGPSVPIKSPIKSHNLSPHPTQSQNNQSTQLKSQKRDPPQRTKAESAYQPKQPSVHQEPVRKPSRTRPEPGAYTLPDPSTNIHDWPRIESTHSSGGSKRSESRSKPKGKEKETDKKNFTPIKNKPPIIIKRPISPNKRPRPPPRPDSSGSRSSTLTPIPTNYASPIAAPLNKDKTAEPSPAKSLSSSPLKGRAFNQLLGDPESQQRVNNGEAEVLQAAKEEVNSSDMLDEFDDYEWATSDGEEPDLMKIKDDTLLASPNKPVSDIIQQPSLARSTPNTPSRHITPSKHLTPAKILPVTPFKPHTSSRSQVTTPHSSLKRPHHTPSPSSAHKRRAMAERSDQLLEDDRVRRQREKEEEAETEKQIQVDLERMHEDNEEQNDDGGDLAGFLDVVASKTPAEPQSSSVKPNFRSAIQARSDSKKAKVEAERLARRQAKLDAVQKAEYKEKQKKMKDETKAFDGLMKKIQLGNDLDEVYKEISLNVDVELETGLESESDGNGENAYPTPETDFDLDDLTSPNLNVIKDGEELDDALDGIEDVGIVIDQSLIKDVKSGIKIEKDDELIWKGFWEEDPRRPEQKDQKRFISFEIIEDPVLKIIDSIAKQPDSEVDLIALGEFITSGAVSFVESGGRGRMGDFLLSNCIMSCETDWSDVARSTFIDLLQDEDYFGKDDILRFLRKCSDLILDLGGRQSVFLYSSGRKDIAEQERSEVMIEREAAMGLFCRILRAASDSAADISWVSILLILSIDKFTSSALGRIIGETIGTLMKKSFDVSKNKLKQAKFIAQSIANSTAEYDHPVKVAILNSLGQKTEESTLVHCWLGIEYLLPGTIDQVSTMEIPPSVPPLTCLLQSVDLISNLLRTPESTEPDYDQINHIISFLYASMSDIENLLNQTTITSSGDKSVKDLLSDCEVEEVRDGLRRCRDRISDQSNGTSKSLVKARLHQLYEISRLILTLGIKKKVRAKKLGKGLKVGTKGQSKLDFGIKPKLEVEERRGVEAESKGERSVNGFSGGEGEVHMEKKGSSGKESESGGVEMENKDFKGSKNGEEDGEMMLGER